METHTYGDDVKVVWGSPTNVIQIKENVIFLKRGCGCKKSNCKQCKTTACKCHEGGTTCGPGCSCVNCEDVSNQNVENTEESEMLILKQTLQFRKIVIMVSGLYLQISQMMKLFIRTNIQVFLITMYSFQCTTVPGKKKIVIYTALKPYVKESVSHHNIAI